MAAGILPKPGTKYGPCKKKACGHTDCARTRLDSQAVCRICQKAIGYNVRYYREDNNGLVHAFCFEKECDDEFKRRSDAAIVAVQQVAAKHKAE